MGARQDASAAIGFAVLVVMFAAIAAFMASGMTADCYSDYYQREAVKHGAAEYDSQTGQWRWKDEKESEADDE